MPAKKARCKKKIKPKAIIVEEEKESEPENFENYQLGSKLGQGAFGSVYLGLDINTGGLVAIKTIPLKKAKGNLASVQSEIDLMSGLNNEHIVQYICSHKTKDYLYIVMEYAEGGSLQHIQKKFANFDEHLAATYIYQVLIGLKYLHSQSIIHRDIKAANILLSNNIAKLSDFGISVNISDPNQHVDVSGQLSAYWSAPEAINMESVTEKSDIWSLGITAIEMFQGTPPYFDLAPIPAMFKIVQNQETPLPEGISVDFKEFLQGCLTRNVTFRKSVDELLQSRWIRKHLGLEIPRSHINYEDLVDDKKSESETSLKLQKFQDSDSDIDEFSSNSKGTSGLGAFAEDDDDDFDLPANPGSLENKPFIPTIVNNNMKQADFAKLDDTLDDTLDETEGSLKDLSDFVENDDDDFNSDPFVDQPGGTGKSLKALPRSEMPLMTLVNEKNVSKTKNSENNFEETMNALDDILADDNTEQQIELEIQRNLMKNQIQEMNTILQIYDDPEKTEQLQNTCRLVKYNFKNEKSLRTQLVQNHGVIPMVEIIQTNNQKLLELALPFISTACKGQPDTQTSLCLFGVLPYLFNYVVQPEFSETIQIKSLKILHSICISQKKPVQMFISAGGLTKLAQVFENFPHEKRPRLTELIIDIIDAVFTFPCRTPKSCFSRILAQSDIIKHLGARYVALPKDSPYLDKLCRIFETFSKGNIVVKRKMAEDKKFIDNLFTKAKYKYQKSGTSCNGLNDWNLFLIIQTVNNLAMDKGIVQLLWNTNLIQYLLEYLQIDKKNIEQFHMNPTLSTCFSAVFHLSRVLTSDCVPKISPLIPLLNHILMKDLPMKEMATTLLLEFINTHSSVKQMRIRLEQNDCVSTLFELFKNNPHKDQILMAFEEWASHNPQIIDSFFIKKRKPFARILVNIFTNESYPVQNQVALKLIGLCDKCKNLAEKLSRISVFIRVLINQLYKPDIEPYPELRASLTSLILLFYQATKSPKLWNGRYNINNVIQKTTSDSSTTVQNIGKLLVQADQLNFFF